MAQNCRCSCSCNAKREKKCFDTEKANGESTKKMFFPVQKPCSYDDCITLSGLLALGGAQVFHQRTAGSKCCLHF